LDAAKKYNFAMVMPSGENAFYLDGLSTGHKYCTYVGKELTEYISIFETHRSFYKKMLNPYKYYKYEK
jgi:hypothetical protein